MIGDFIDDSFQGFSDLDVDDGSEWMRHIAESIQKSGDDDLLYDFNDELDPEFTSLFDD